MVWKLCIILLCSNALSIVHYLSELQSRGQIDYGANIRRGQQAYKTIYYLYGFCKQIMICTAAEHTCYGLWLFLEQSGASNDADLWDFTNVRVMYMRFGSSWKRTNEPDMVSLKREWTVA